MPAAAQSGTPSIPGSSTEAEAKARAKELIAEGNDRLREGDYEAALESYSSAYEAYPSAKIRLNKAEAMRQLGRFAAALKEYELFLSETELGPGTPLVARAQSRAKEVRALVGQIKVTSNVDGASVTVDAAPVGRTPMSQPIIVDPGSHAVRIEKDPYPGFFEEVTVSAGETRQLDASLVLPRSLAQSSESRPNNKQLTQTPPMTASTEAKDEGGSVFGEWWFWTAAIVVVGAGVGTGIALTTGGDDFVPGGEFGVTGLSEWEQF